MRTTLTIDDDVAVQIERLRRDRGVSLKRVVNETLRHGLREMADKKTPGKAFRTRVFDMGAARIPSLDNVAEALAVAEGEAFR